MRKQTTINIEDSNIAHLGSDLHKECVKNAAKSDPAWANAGKKEGLEIWRIEKFVVCHWDKEQYGSFYSGDSYIVLNTYKVENALKWNVHFWLGAHTTQDEAGTAAYKTVELDTLLDDAPVQFREVMGHESEEFLSLFPHGIKIMEGGVDSGFRHVEPEKYRGRLLHVKGTRKTVTAMEVPMEAASFNSGDVFILDEGLKVFVWQGKSAGIWEKQKAAELARAIDDERKSAVEITVCNEGSDGDFPWNTFGGKPDTIAPATPDTAPVHVIKLLRVSDASGKLETTEIATGDAVTKDKLDDDDVFILDAGHTIYAYVGKNASPDERKNALGSAQTYLSSSGKPAWTPISRVLHASKADQFYASFHA